MTNYPILLFIFSWILGFSFDKLNSTNCTHTVCEEHNLINNITVRLYLPELWLIAWVAWLWLAEKARSCSCLIVLYKCNTLCDWLVFYQLDCDWLKWSEAVAAWFFLYKCNMLCDWLVFQQLDSDWLKCQEAVVAWLYCINVMGSVIGWSQLLDCDWLKGWEAVAAWLYCINVTCAVIGWCQRPDCDW